MTRAPFKPDHGTSGKLLNLPKTGFPHASGTTENSCRGGTLVAGSQILCSHLRHRQYCNSWLLKAFSDGLLHACGMRVIPILQVRH